MYLKQHVLLSALFSVLLYPVFGWWVLIIFFSGWLVDSDHYLECVVRKKSLSLKKAYNYYLEKDKNDKILLRQGKKPKFVLHLHVFHTIEAFLLILLFSIYFDFFKFVLIGFVFHQLLDVVYFFYQKYQWPKAQYDRVISMVFEIKKIL